jgi:hypothetical protein
VSEITAGPTLDPDDVAPPPFNGDLAAVSLRWCAAAGAPLFCRLLLVALSLVAGDDGRVGGVSDTEAGHLVGLAPLVTRAHRAWLVRRGGLLEQRRPGLCALLWVGQAVLDLVPTAAVLDAAPEGVAYGDGDAGVDAAPPILMGEHL